MSLTLLFFVLLLLSATGFYMGRAAAVGASATTQRPLHSLSSFYGWYVLLWCGIPAMMVYVVWIALEGPIVELLVARTMPEAAATGNMGLALSEMRNIAAGITPPGAASAETLRAVEHYKWLSTIAGAALWVVALAAGVMGLAFARGRVSPELRARNSVERVLEIFFLIASVIAILTTIGILLSLIFETVAFFLQVSPIEFLFSTAWSPMLAIRPDQVGASGSFGAVPLFLGTMLIASIAMLTAVPIGLMTAVYMTEYAPKVVRAWGKPILEILAGIPTVVFGFFAALTVAPAIRDFGALIGLEIAAQSALAAGIVMGLMLIPFVSSLSDDVINAVPQSMRDGSYALGATKSETTMRVLLPAALPGIMASVILAFSKALGETMIVVMAAGIAANTTLNPLESVTTVTVNISALLTGEAEFDSPKTLAAFALGFVLFVVTLALNLVALKVVQRYREQYE
ncbi:MAG: phosphate ABC transporter permease subunit PstC [Azospirillum sp.]|nr:phosphate ABC transporter permease subunit PstC [Azospirillum sp.]MCZ8123321.1 phosphate ABC transporter permease subunit PstC [Magnetospirillum sp.]